MSAEVRYEDDNVPASIPLPNIAFIGGAGAGKTTAADLLVEYFGYKRLSFAEPLKAIAERIWGPTARTDRDKLQRLGVAVRDIDSDAWARLLIRDIQTNVARSPRRYVVDDCRFANEHAWLATEGFVFVKVQAPQDTRIDRLRANGKLQDVSQLNHVSETSLDHVAPNYAIFNDGSRENLASEVVSIINREARRV